MNEYSLEKEKDPILGFTDDYRFLSNFWVLKNWVSFGGYKFPSVEHAYQFAKIDTQLLDGMSDEDLQNFYDEFVEKTPGQIKRAAKKFPMRPNWEKNKYKLMLNLVHQKFERNSKLLKMFLATKKRTIFELNTWGDTYWGVVQKGDKLVGFNYLGMVLTQVRYSWQNPCAVVVTGGRDFSDEELVNKALKYINSQYRIKLLIQGEASGADLLCKEWAESRKIKTKDFPAKWDDLDGLNVVIKTNRAGKKYNARAGFERNAEMIRFALKLKLNKGAMIVGVSFPGGNGTAHMTELMLSAKFLTMKAHEDGKLEFIR